MGGETEGKEMEFLKNWIHHTWKKKRIVQAYLLKIPEQDGPIPQISDLLLKSFLFPIKLLGP
jgi:hypothetical protein